jgi:transcription-repair coupling factor (superfamily II helicase)
MNKEVKYFINESMESRLLSSLRINLPAATSVIFLNAPEGLQPFVLANPAFQEKPLVYIAKDEEELDSLKASLSFLQPERTVLTFPAWDCLPYDRLSPSQDILGKRLETLVTLRNKSSQNVIVLTSIAAFLQKLPPRHTFENALFSLKKQAVLNLEHLTTYLLANGYLRVETVREPGEYAMRGHIIDLFPSQASFPYRIDLFGDEIESIKSFDPLTQRSNDDIETILLIPTSEVLLKDETVLDFRKKYRENFGIVGERDPLYQSISAKKAYSGMEHWLPLFYSSLDTFIDYLPKDAFYFFSYKVEEAALARFEQINEHYQARLDFLKTKNLKDQEAEYHPVKPELLFLFPQQLNQILENDTCFFFSPFSAAEKEGASLDLDAQKVKDFTYERSHPDINLFEALKETLLSLIKGNSRVLIPCMTSMSQNRLFMLLKDHGFERITIIKTFEELESIPPTDVALTVLPLEHGFRAGNLVVLTEQDILGEKQAKAPKRRKRSDLFIGEATQLNPGDYLVHIDHGIGRYEGLHTLQVNGNPHDCVCLIYEGSDKLFVPVENLDILSRYGGEHSQATLDKLGSASWQARKAVVKKRLKEMADHLIKLAAQRHVERADVCIPPQGAYEEFCSRFAYNETEDQLRAIEETITDLESGKPLDRLICGDVGFGKTEIALRAAFVAASSHKQVAVIVPTTLLCQQHYLNFKTRFEGFGIRVEALSRLVSAKNSKNIKASLKDGRTRIIIGTQSLLSKEIHFENLGLVIIDEEQHFGVKQKERLKELKNNVHILTLTATPIPRTLQLALSGVKDMSIIATPPVDRLAVRTFVMPFDSVMIKEAILRERYRGGQIFYVSPRIENLPAIAEELNKLLPDLKVAIAHGQMTAKTLETTMLDFVEKKYDVLLATNIIESGLDIPSVNTLIIDRSDLFGLSQLYQLRGRVGRTKIRAYAYLLVPSQGKLTVSAQKRLEVIQTLDTLGAGFQLASYDMDIRGAGNLLGEEQSGHIKEVGIELYQQMLEEAVHAAQNRDTQHPTEPHFTWTPEINLSIPLLIPEKYVPDLSVRLNLYHRLSHLKTKEEIDDFKLELMDRFGEIPWEVENLLKVIYLKQLCWKTHVQKIEVGDKGGTVTFYKNTFANPGGLVEYINRNFGTIKLRPDHKLVFLRAFQNQDDRLTGTEKILTELDAILSGQ